MRSAMTTAANERKSNDVTVKGLCVSNAAIKNTRMHEKNTR